MTKKCLYCNCNLSEDAVVDFCEQCGKGVWGEKMYNAIIENMTMNPTESLSNN